MLVGLYIAGSNHVLLYITSVLAANYIFSCLFLFGFRTQSVQQEQFRQEQIKDLDDRLKLLKTQYNEEKHAWAEKVTCGSAVQKSCLIFQSFTIKSRNDLF